MIPITMAVHNRPRITEISVREIARRTMLPFDLIVFDDGSDFTTQERLNFLVMDDKIHLCIWHRECGGIHFSRNQLLDEVQECDFFVSTDNDIVPQSPVDGKDWLGLLTELMDRHPDYAAIALRPHIMIGDNANKMFADADEVVERGHVGAVLRMMRTEAVLGVGGWSKKIQPGRDNEEKWICSRLRRAGWKVGYSRDIRAIHLFGNPDLGEDPWGYDASLRPEDHGHREIWPPAHHYQWDRLGIDWETCR